MTAEPLPPSLYAATTPPGPPTPPLAADARTDVAIVGGGITGLSLALHLGEAGVEATLLEANEPGWGASGRNGGQVNPGLKPDPDAVLATFGERTGRALVDLAWGAPDALFATIARHQIRCEARQQGTLRAARGAAAARAVRASADEDAAHGMPVRWLDAAAMEQATGSAAYAGGMLDPRGGDVNPLALSRGLAAAALRAGARLHGATRATALRRDGDGWEIGTAAGFTLRARRVVLATNGYSDALLPGLAQSVVPVFSSIVATAPLPAPLAEAILPARCSVYEAGTITVYYRVDAEGRLILGGRGPQYPIGAIDPIRYLIRHAGRLWPRLRGAVAWTHGWNGQIAMTRDHLPHLHTPAPGLYALLGYNGRGVALAHALGKALAASLATGAAMPLPASPIAPIPLHRFWRLGVAAGMLAGRARDAVERWRGG